jgi:hypothetical protein
MLGVAVFGMTVSCLLLGLEVAGYDKEQPFQAVSLPKVEPRPGRRAGAAPAPTAAPRAWRRPTRPPLRRRRLPGVVPTLPTPPAVAKTEPPKLEPPRWRPEPRPAAGVQPGRAEAAAAVNLTVFGERGA